jgi:uncharacterized LabA/DUF88 family protein
MPFAADPQLSANELDAYCHRHLTEYINGMYHNHNLYRIFYYDCPPLSITVYNPMSKNNIELGKSQEFQWTTEFFDALREKRKFALRLGKLSETNICYSLTERALKDLLSNKKTVSELTDKDLYLNLKQKGVDIKIGVDIASLAYNRQVNQIVLISGDSDFVPAAKLARREGIDFVLDPLGANIKSDLFTNIDGLITKDDRFKSFNK